VDANTKAAAETIGYPEVKRNPEVEYYEGTSWGSLFLGLLVVAMFVGVMVYAGKLYLDSKVEIVKLQSEIKYNCLPKTQ
jgi:hypothetical protein